jgi:glycosyltransferase involved in cell wall biosynthesis
VRIAYIGDFINHGKTLVPTGTSLVLLLSEIPDVRVIDVYCPVLNVNVEPFNKPEKVAIIESYSYDNPSSIMKLLKVRRKYYDKVIFNIMPTVFGNSNFSNLTGLLIPLILRLFFRERNLEIIYHNSVYTNDIAKLGYDSLYDRLRSLILGVVERGLFKYVKTFVLLGLYKDRIAKKIGNNKIKVLNGRYLEAIATVYMNAMYDHDYLLLPERNQMPIILMHGSWGPQKNVELGLNALLELKKKNFDFDLIISGGINHHFKEYEKEFNLLLNRYNKIIKKYFGLVKEIDIMKLFTSADLLILPYNTPGGHSAVLEQAIFFEVPTIAIDFPEYEEQIEGISFVKLATSRKDLEEYVSHFLINTWNGKSEINIKEKKVQAINNVKVLLYDD